MSDLETRLRALADAASSVATQPTTDELFARPRPAQRKWLPVTAIAAATAGVVVLVGVHPWAGGGKLPAGTPSTTLDAACAGESVAFRLSGGSMAPEDLAALVRTRVGAVTSDGCVVTDGHGAVDVRLGEAGRSALTARSLRGELFVAPVRQICQPLCDLPPVGSLPGSDGARYVLDESKKLDLTNHLAGASAGLVPQSSTDWQVTLRLDSETTPLFARLTADAIRREASSDHSATVPPANQVAIVKDGIVVAAPVVQAEITDGNVQISGNFTEHTAKAFATQVTARSVPADVTIERVPGSTAVPSSANAACVTRPVAFVVKATASQPLDTLAELVRKRVNALSTNSCVELTPERAINIRVDPSERTAVTLASLRGELWIAPVKDWCESPACPPAGSPGVYASAHSPTTYVLGPED